MVSKRKIRKKARKERNRTSDELKRQRATRKERTKRFETIKDPSQTTESVTNKKGITAKTEQSRALSISEGLNFINQTRANLGLPQADLPATKFDREGLQKKEANIETPEGKTKLRKIAEDPKTAIGLGVGIAALATGGIAAGAGAGAAAGGIGRASITAKGIFTGAGVGAGNIAKKEATRIVSKKTLLKLGQIAGVTLGADAIATWFAADNIASAIPFQMNSVIEAVEKGAISRSEAENLANQAQSQLDFSRETINTSTRINPFLWPARKRYMRGIEGIQVQIDTKKILLLGRELEGGI